MNAYELADALKDDWADKFRFDAATMLRQQADRIAELEKEIEECWCGGHSYDYLRAKNRLPQTKTENIWTSCSACGQKVTEDLIHTCSPQLKPLSDEVFNKTFDYYCETDEGVLKFDLELRTEWKQEQLQRWKEAFRKAWD